jgi:hypothetical protein
MGGVGLETAARAPLEEEGEASQTSSHSIPTAPHYEQHLHPGLQTPRATGYDAKDCRKDARQPEHSLLQFFQSQCPDKFTK